MTSETKALHQRIRDLESELYRARKAAVVGEEALRKRIAELESEVAKLREQTKPKGGLIYGAPFA